MTQPLRVEQLSKSHNRKAFNCGVPALDAYFQTQVSQDVKRRVANCFVAVEVSTGNVAAYYTLSAASIPLTDLPEELRNKLPRYPTVPAVRIGRLAVSTEFQGQKLGSAMLGSAAVKAASDSAAAFALLVDAKDETGAQFYVRYGFTRFTSLPLSLFMPLSEVRHASAF